MFGEIKKSIIDDGIGGIIVILIVAGTIGYWIGVWNSKTCDKCASTKIRMTAAEVRQDEERARAYISGWNDCKERFHIGKSEQEQLNAAYDSGYAACLIEIGKQQNP